MTVEVFYGAAIPRESLSPIVEYLLAKWKTLKSTNDLTLQRLTEEASYPIQENLIYLLPMRDDFVFMYVGQNIQTIIGFNPTGALLSSIDDPVSRNLEHIYTRVSQDNQPALARFKVPRPNATLMRQRLIMPIKIGDTTLLVSYSENLAERGDILNYLFRTSPYATFIIYPTVGKSNQYEDAWILASNDAAQSFIGLTEPPDERETMTLRSFAPFASPDFWVAMRRAFLQATPRPIFKFVSMEVEVLRFGTITALRMRN